MGNIKYLFKIFLFSSFIVPLFIDIGPVGIATWTGPFLALLYIKLAEYSTGRSQVRAVRIGKWEVSGFLFVFWMYISTFSNSYYYTYPERDGLLFVYSLSILFAIFVRQNWGDIFRSRTVIRFGFVMVAIQSVVGISQFVTNSTIGFPAQYFGSQGGTDLLATDEAVRIIGTLDSTPTVLARAISIFLPFFVIYPVSSTLPSRTWRVIAVLAGCVLVFMTQSRSAALVLGGGLALWLFQRSRVALRMLVRLRATWSGIYFTYLFIVILGAGAVVLQQAGGISYLQRAVASTVYRFENITLLGNRFELMRGAIILFWEQPVLGNGYLSTMYLAEQTDILIVPSWRSSLRVHNAYLQFLAEGGLISFVSYSYFTLYPVYRLFNSKINNRVRYAFLSTTIMIVLLSQTSTAYDRYSLAPLYMLFVGGAMGVVDTLDLKSPTQSENKEYDKI
jgi:O-antigen ligase